MDCTTSSSSQDDHSNNNNNNTNHVELESPTLTTPLLIVEENSIINDKNRYRHGNKCGLLKKDDDECDDDDPDGCNSSDVHDSKYSSLPPTESTPSAAAVVPVGSSLIRSERRTGPTGNTTIMTVESTKTPISDDGQSRITSTETCVKLTAISLDVNGSGSNDSDNNSNNVNNNQDDNNHGTNTPNDTVMTTSSLLEGTFRAVATLGMIGIGLTVVFVIFCWPLLVVPRLLLSHHSWITPPSPATTNILIPSVVERDDDETVSTTIVTNHHHHHNVMLIVGFWTAIAELVHILALIYLDDYPFHYLYVHRKIVLPIRIVLMPLVNHIIMSDGIMECTPTWYNHVGRRRGIAGDGGSSIDDSSLRIMSTTISSRITTPTPPTSSSNSENTTTPTTVLVDIRSLLSQPSSSPFKGSVRRDLRKKLRLYEQRKVVSVTTHSDYLSLRNDVPVMWEHEQRAVRDRPDKSAIEEFIKRFLVVFLVSNAYIDRYYYSTDGDGGDDDNNSNNNNTNTNEETTSLNRPSTPTVSQTSNTTTITTATKLVALSTFVVCDDVLNVSMYFCIDDAAGYGIWQYNHIRAYVRGTIAAQQEDLFGNDDDNNIGINNNSNKNIRYVNFFHHQDYAKRLAGAQAADPKDIQLLRMLFPFWFYREPPPNIVNVKMDLSWLRRESTTGRGKA